MDGGAAPHWPTVCFFQAYNRTYGRSEALLAGLLAHGVPIVRCQVNRRSMLRYPLAVGRFLARQRRAQVVVANFRCFEILWLLRLLTRKPILYDAHLSVWQAVCEERRWFGERSLVGRLLLFFDRWNCRRADHVLTDTRAHREFFIERLGVPPGKVTAVYISCESELFQPSGAVRESSAQRIAFWAGSGIPHQGLKVIMEAFARLQEQGVPVVLRLAGWSRIVARAARLAERRKIANVVFLGQIPRAEVVEETERADFCLGGPFLAIPKTRQVIAGKVFEMIAMGKATVVGDSPAARELFSDGVDALLCPMGSPAALAEAVARLTGDAELRARLGAAGAELYRTRLRPEINVEPLLPVLVRLSVGR